MGGQNIIHWALTIPFRNIETITCNRSYWPFLGTVPMFKEVHIDDIASRAGAPQIANGSLLDGDSAAHDNGRMNLLAMRHAAAAALVLCAIGLPSRGPHRPPAMPLRHLAKPSISVLAHGLNET